MRLDIAKDLLCCRTLDPGDFSCGRSSKSEVSSCLSSRSLTKTLHFLAHLGHF